MSRFTHALILGGSSGIGAELARQLAAAGTKVLVVGRDADRLAALAATHPDRILTLNQDLCDWTSPNRITLAGMAEKLGGLDLVIWAAAIMPEVELDEFDAAKDTAMITTNFTAAVAWLDEAAARFQAAGSGTIVGIGSVAGDRGRPGKPAYNASKAALATYLEALRNRLTRKGVTVVTIKPGPVDTPMTATHTVKKMPAAEAARRILAASSRPGEHYLKLSHRIIFAVIRLIPGPIFRRMNI
ncbi:MAG TPA: SDR family NAD(P)-dependent oxidoreductase [Fimbriimonadaceae bacterium]|nr:SDR family NAD(P)-dependent oxidoreductase [Fimbriimonadaceae bacterium]